MTRTHKNNDIPHNHPEAEPAYAEHQIPKFFGKNGFADADPNKVKKNGSGRGNWGHTGQEIDDLSEFTTFKQRRRSNSTSHVDQVTSKFEVREDEPVFEEETMGAAPTDLESVAKASSSTVNGSTA